MGIKIQKNLFEVVNKFREETDDYVFNEETSELVSGGESFIKACIRWAECHNYQMVRTVHALKIYCNGYEVYYDNISPIDYFRFFKACDWLLEKLLSTEDTKLSILECEILKKHNVKCYSINRSLQV